MQILATKTEKEEEITGTNAQVCNQCNNKIAEIFQINGEYCLECWQTITHTSA